MPLGARAPRDYRPGAYQSVLADEYTSLIVEGGTSVISSPLEPAIGPDDVLVVVDAQNDFVPEQNAPLGGRFGIPEGDSASQNCVKLIRLFSSRAAKIIAARDYHPKNHCSFNCTVPPGPFPEHCLQGSQGAAFYPPVAEALSDARQQSGRVHIVFKGFHQHIDSFGTFPYRGTDAIDSGRLSCSDRSCCPDWTGGLELTCSNQDSDISANPDVLSIIVDKNRNMEVLLDEGGDSDKTMARRIFVCGLTMDFGCSDTIMNALAYGYTNVYLIVDAARAAHISGVGRHGTGFLTDPREFAKRIEGCQIITTAAMS